LFPLYLFQSTMRPHFPLARPRELPGARQFVQDVTGLGRFIKGLA
jgi:hypothetical protein